MYLSYKKQEKIALDHLKKSGDPDALLWLLETCWGSNGEVGEGILSRKLRSYRYSHSDLTKDEMKTLYKMNGLNDDESPFGPDHLVGGEIHRVVGEVERKRLVLTKVDEIDLFQILEQIQWIIKKRK